MRLKLKEEYFPEKKTQYASQAWLQLASWSFSFSAETCLRVECSEELLSVF